MPKVSDLRKMQDWKISTYMKFLIVPALAIAIAKAPEAILQINELKSTAQEKRLEERIGVPIYFRDFMSWEERNENLFYFEKFFDEFRENWDFADKYLHNVSRFILRDRTPLPYAGFFYPRDNSVELRTYRGDNIVHELGHAWHNSITDKNGFDKNWQNISGAIYGNTCSVPTDIEDAGAVDDYALTDTDEDVARTIELVYCLNNPYYEVLGDSSSVISLPRETHERLQRMHTLITKKGVPKIDQKVQLLFVYGAFSQREYDTSLKALNTFREATKPK